MTTQKQELKKKKSKNEHKPPKTKGKGRKLFEKGNQMAVGNGRPKDTPESKAKRQVIKEYKKNYTAKLEELLPTIPPALKKEIKKGNIPAIKEVHDRVLGKVADNVNLNAKITASDIINGIHSARRRRTGTDVGGQVVPVEQSLPHKE